MVKEDWNNELTSLPGATDKPAVATGALSVAFSQLILSGLNWDTEKLASATFDILKYYFAEVCDMKIKKNIHFKIHMMRKGIEQKNNVSQIEITLTKDSKYNIHLNDYNRFEEGYFDAQGLNIQELMNEVENLKAFLNDQKMSEDTKIQRNDYNDLVSL